MLTRLNRTSLLLVSAASVAFAACDRGASQTETTSTTPIEKQVVAPIASSIETSPKPTASTWMTHLDPDMKEVIDALISLNGKPIESLSAADARKQPTPADAVKAVLQKHAKSTAPEEVGNVEDRTIPTAAGKLWVRLYTPKGKGPFPVVVYFHGGGWVIATNDTYDATPRALANGVDAIVMSVEYRKAPENKFPAAHDDALAAYEWTLKNAASIGGDPNKVAVAGESAGGNLAANVAIAARDKKEKLPTSLLLVYPVASSNLETPSEVENADAKPLNHAMMPWFTNNYFRTPADGKDPRISLVDANLKGLPPTMIINAEIDPLRSDGESLAAKMREAGVKVEQKTFAGVTHEFFGMGAVVSKARSAQIMGANAIKSSFGG